MLKHPTFTSVWNSHVQNRQNQGSSVSLPANSGQTLQVKNQKVNVHSKVWSSAKGRFRVMCGYLKKRNKQKKNYISIFLLKIPPKKKVLSSFGALSFISLSKIRWVRSNRHSFWEKNYNENLHCIVPNFSPYLPLYPLNPCV